MTDRERVTYVDSILFQGLLHVAVSPRIRANVIDTNRRLLGHRAKNMSG